MNETDETSHPKKQNNLRRIMHYRGKKKNQTTNLRWLAITPHPACLDIFTASILSVTDPIWLTCSKAYKLIEEENNSLITENLENAASQWGKERVTVP